MVSLLCSLEGRSFQAMLNGLCKRLFYDDATITTDFLYEQLYSGIELTIEEAKAQMSSFEEVLKV